jgi:hypothetical protein
MSVCLGTVFARCGIAQDIAEIILAGFLNTTTMFSVSKTKETTDEN